MIEAPAPFPAEVAKIPRGAALRRGLRANPLLVVGAVASICIVVVALPATLTTVIIAIAISWWPWYVRLIRGQAASVTGRPYIEACRALGIPPRRIILRHILPNSVTPLIVQMSLDVGGVILTASALSF